MHLALKSLGKLLRLAERLERERAEESRDTRQSTDHLMRELEEVAAGVFERQSAERNLNLFLESLNEDEKKDVIALFYLGRDEGDFKALRDRPPIPTSHISSQLVPKTDLESSLIEGLKKLAE